MDAFPTHFSDLINLNLDIALENVENFVKMVDESYFDNWQ
jgi:hypothetical protein